MQGLCARAGEKLRKTSGNGLFGAFLGVLQLSSGRITQWNAQFDAGLYWVAKLSNGLCDTRREGALGCVDNQLHGAE